MSATIPQPPDMPDPPQRGQGATPFWTKCDAWVQAMYALGAYLKTFVTFVADVITEVTGLRDNAAASAATAQIQAQAAAASVLAGTSQADRATAQADRSRDYADAAKSLAGTAITGTSTSNLTLGTGAKALTVETGKAFVVGARVELCATSDPVGHRMSGPVLSYSATTGALTVAVDTVTGSGTYASWSARIVPEVPAARPTYQHFLANS
ncbi:hypothetical protein DFW101_0315 [Solidesulfovibrio carbinoliphilus subsp. oakridgensis]|uniref:Uncharacterized protein n=1 Tax=Solidesulfovibrio carbinoliphilus subsp. oakridgensis TaxID=694327 RepID=G7QD26_9BACT|nr:hypothetical protein [Solidesulfovibrio carbinoliphilus]EHJ46332.1 hypothetical protein DFW101_0315 [Solidesulfovibrio carbinoliphilus subsp. oakridgensis]